MAFHISVSSKSTDIHLEYPEGIQLNGPYEVALKHLVTYNNIPNVSVKQGNYRLTLTKPTIAAGLRPGLNEVISSSNNTPPAQPMPEGENKVVLDLPTGVYEVDDITEAIRASPITRNSSTHFRVNRNTLRIQAYSSWNIDFKNDPFTIGRLLGFSPQIIPAAVVKGSDLPIDIYPTTSIKIFCNLVQGNIENLNRNSSVLHQFPLAVEPGEKIIVQPATLSFYPINTTCIYDLNIQICDQDGKPLDLQGERIDITLELQPMQWR